MGRRDVSVWRDKSDIADGDVWRDSIEEGILASSSIVALLSRASAESPYFLYECGFGIGAGVPIIPILFEPRSADWKIHPRLEVLQQLDFSNQPDGPWGELAGIVKKQILQKNKPQQLSEISVEEFKSLLGSTIALANASSKSEARPLDTNAISNATERVASVVSARQERPTDQIKILWVDDRPGNNTFERKMFEELGISFILARSTDEALKILESNDDIAVIISDMGRVEGPQEGYVLLEQVRKTDSHLPFVIYAGSSSPQHTMQAQKRGAQGSTNSPEELFTLVMNAVSNGSRNPNSPRSTHSPE